MTQQQWGPPQGQRPPANQGWGNQGWANQGGEQGWGHQQRQPQFQQPGRRKNPLKTVLLALIGLTAVALVGLVLVNVLGGTSTVAYQNDDYEVPPADTSPPPLPQPETYEEAEKLLTANPFYDQLVPAPVRCEIEKIDWETFDDEQLDAHFEEQLACLTRAWQPPVENAGFTIVRPSVTIYTDKVQTKCGEVGVNAAYCSADQQTYFSSRLLEALPQLKASSWGTELIMAHEFGHAVQARTGILYSMAAMSQQAGDEKAELQYSRRLEVQADCLAGMWFRSVSVSMGLNQQELEQLEEIMHAIGDDQLSGDANVVGNHGHGASRKYWTQMGMGNDQVGKCNTFKAEENLVR